MSSNSTIRAAVELFERRLLPAGHPEALSQAGLELELARLQGRAGPAQCQPRWRAPIELSQPRESDAGGPA